MPSPLRQAYERRVAAGALTVDLGQSAGLIALERLGGDLAEDRTGGVFRKSNPVTGVYLWGPVGRGKSMLMDLFFATAPTTAKRRVHFHVFMGEVHALVNAWRTGDAAARHAQFQRAKGEDPIPPVARRIASQARLLCFDELQVTDIADAMILGRLFEALFARGVTLVATSNRPPGELYLDGINRQLFVPFIAMLEQRMQIVAVDGGVDYRLGRLRATGTWFSPIDPKSERAFDSLWRALLGPGEERGVTLEVLGRSQTWPRAVGGLLRAHFNSLCVQALGPADYLAIAARFQTVFIEAIPRLGPAMRNEARRLATLIDTLYEARSRLVVLAAGEPDTLYPAGDQAFEFRRAASRLAEMRSPAWLESSPSATSAPRSCRSG